MRQITNHLKPLIYCFFILSLVLLSTNAFAAIINVPTPAYPTIQVGIDAAKTGDTILLADGTYTGVGNKNLVISKYITMKSENGPSDCIIDCENNGNFYLLTKGTLEGLTIKNSGIGLEVQNMENVVTI